MAFLNSFDTSFFSSLKRRPRSMLGRASSSPLSPTRQWNCPVVMETKSKSPSQTEPSGSEMTVKPGKIRAPRQMRGGGRVRRGVVSPQGKKYSTVRLPPNPPGLRVSSGVARGRRILSPNVYLRPMMSKVREALFSMLKLLGALRTEGSALDLFAGSGSVGIEALSRGMHRAVFVDFAKECIETVEKNLENCQFVEQGEGVCARVEDFLKEGTKYNGGRHYDLITITPPYEEVDYSELMQALLDSDCVGEGTFVVIEYPVELGCLPPAIGHRLIGIRNRRYGRTVLAVYACQPDGIVDIRPEEFIDTKGKKKKMKSKN